MNRKNIKQPFFSSDIKCESANLYNSNSETDILLREEAEWLASWYSNTNSETKNVDEIQIIDKSLSVSILEEIKNQLAENFKKSEEHLNTEKELKKEILNRLDDQDDIFKSQEIKMDELNNKFLDEIQVLKKEVDNFHKVSEENKKYFENLNEDSFNEMGNHLSHTLNLLKENNNAKNDLIHDNFMNVKDEFVQRIEESIRLNSGLIRESSEYFGEELDRIKEKQVSTDNTLEKMVEGWTSLNQRIEEFETKIHSYLYSRNEENGKFEKNISEINDKVEAMNRKVEESNDLSNVNSNRIDQHETKFDDLFNNVQSIKNNDLALIGKEIENFNTKLNSLELRNNQSLGEIARSSSLIIDYIENGSLMSALINSPEFEEKLKSEFDQNFTTFKEGARELESDIHSKLTEAVNNVKYLEEQILKLTRNEVQSEFSHLVATTNWGIDSKVSSSRQEIYDEMKNMGDLFDSKISNIKSQVNLNAENLSKLQEIISSGEINQVIFDKLILIVEEKMDTIRQRIADTQENLLRDIETLEAKFRDNEETLSASHVKIKDDTLKVIYEELDMFETKVNLLNEDTMRNYETLMRNTRALDTLEKLLNDQLHCVEGHEGDKRDIVESLICKIEDHKNLIDEIKNKLDFVLEKNNVLDDFKKTLEENKDDYFVEDDLSYETIKDLTLDLVKEEIAKIETNDATEKRNSSGTYFDYKIKELLKTLLEQEGQETKSNNTSVSESRFSNVKVAEDANDVDATDDSYVETNVFTEEILDIERPTISYDNNPRNVDGTKEVFND